MVHQGLSKRARLDDVSSSVALIRPSPECLRGISQNRQHQAYIEPSFSVIIPPAHKCTYSHVYVGLQTNLLL